ncbi:MAG: RimJ/RimL family protein N-acetyltransferase [Gammaproteobacteria bacterium]|jgi:RimJ/RimL family protein N-acetyltransferase
MKKETNSLEQPYLRPLSSAQVNVLPSALIPSRQPIRGHTVELVPQDAAKHADDLFKAGHSTDQALKIWDYLAYGPWPDADAYNATMRAQSATFDTIFFAVRPLDSNHYQGQTSFLDINPQMGIIEIGHIWFGPELQRTRAATEALYLMIKYAMDELGYRRMQWRCNSRNEKSRQAARRLGFRFEGVFYNHMIFKGKNRDTAWYSILDDEWPEVRGNLETWLADENFDNDDAKTSLFDSMQNRSPSRRGDPGE